MTAKKQFRLILCGTWAPNHGSGAGPQSIVKSTSEISVGPHIHTTRKVKVKKLLQQKRLTVGEITFL